MSQPRKRNYKVEVRPIDYWGQAMYSVFVNGVEQTSAYPKRLPVTYREVAETFANELKEELNELQN